MVAHRQSSSSQENRILATIRDHVDRLGIHQTARLLGLDRSTVSRRLSANRLQSWSVADLAKLCGIPGEALGSQTYDAIGRILLPEQASFGDRFEREALQVITHIAGFIDRLCTSVLEGNRSAVELKRIRTDLDSLSRRLKHLVDEIDRLKGNA